MKKIELLAPAGSKESLIAAVESGADAVYLGGTHFGARAFANNFDHEGLKEAVTYCHLRDVKVYVTMNTLLFETEIDKAVEEAYFLYQIGVDALLVQDLGLIQRLRKQLPDMPLHASTQLHVHNLEGVEVCQSLGFERVVVARETPLEKVKEWHDKTGMDIEVFAYGALCVSYSGQCLMSSITQNRSGNRGICAQCCRLQYDLKENGKKVKTPGSYLLSPKDLNIIDELPALIETGAGAIKIEGRMKRPEYVALVVTTFREAIDAYYEGKPYKMSNERKKELKLLFNREFTKGYLFHENDTQLLNPIRPNHIGIPLGKVTDCAKGRVTIELVEDLNMQDGIRFLLNNEDIGMTVTRMFKGRDVVKQAFRGESVSVSVDGYVPKGTEVVKTTDKVLMDKIHLMQHDHKKKVVLHAKVSAYVGAPLMVTLSDGKGHEVTVMSEYTCDYAKSDNIEATLKDKLSKTGDSVYTLVFDEIEMDHVFIPVKVINEVKREALAMMDEARLTLHRNSELLPYEPIEYEEKYHQDIIAEVMNQEQYQELKGNYLTFMNDLNAYPNVHEDYMQLRGATVLISSIGDLNKRHVNKYFGPMMNVTNSYAMDFLFERGAAGVTISTEVNDSMFGALMESYIERNGKNPAVYYMAYGRRDLMITKAHIVSKALSKKNSVFTLEDKKKQEYPLIVDSRGLTHIIEDKPFISQGNYLRFTIESAEEIREELL